jgi:tetratricopeptide (TPR) repeat protein
MVRAWLAAWIVLITLGFSHAADNAALLRSDQRWEDARKTLAQGKAAEAGAAFENLLQEYPNEADLHLFLAMSLLRQREPHAAVVSSQRAIALDPHHSEARTLLGYVELEVRGDADAAIREYKKVIEMRPDLPQAYSNLAAAQKKKGELEEAIASLDQALAQNPAYAAALTMRGGIHAERNRWAEARRDFEAALKLDAEDDGALYGLSQALREARDYAGAQQALSLLISRSPNFVYWLEWGRIGLIRFWWVLLMLAIALTLKGRFKKARTKANG